ncbi:MAG: hypothetical protein HYU25_08415 [Candidatus Rokubacteria bacterium]|nr:hypothetical protein [Candidatus Rokubacteria bacterium]
MEAKGWCHSVLGRLDDKVRSLHTLTGRYVYQFGHRGLTLHLEHALIGATAMTEGLILVTRNVSRFPMLSLEHNLIRFHAR